MRRLAAACLAAALASSPARGAVNTAFPQPGEVFEPLLADPREIQTALRYYQSGGLNLADVALGNAWGLWRWEVPAKSGRWLTQLDVAGMAYSRFRLSGGVNEFQTIDFFAKIPVEVRRGRLSARASLFHESSHLGDDYIRRTGDQGFRYSVEGVQALVSFEPHPQARVYTGGMGLIHQIPRGQHGAYQSGVELRTPKLIRKGPPCWFYLAQDVQWLGRQGWKPNSSTVLGFRLGVSRVVRAMTFQIGYFSGRSAFGQFLRRNENYWDVGVGFEF